MTALEEAHASTEIAPFLACGGDYLQKGVPTLSTSTVFTMLDKLEALWSSTRDDVSLSASARVQALRHYHSVYAVCAGCVPLTPTMWSRWHESLCRTYLPSSPEIDDAASETPPSKDFPLSTLQAELVAHYWHLYSQLWWGSAAAANVRLARAVEDADRVLSTLDALSTGATNSPSKAAVMQVEQLETLLEGPLHAFSRLAAESAHLYGIYITIGLMERHWLNDTVASFLGEVAEMAVEVLVRRSYKRDLQVPFVGLSNVLREYEETEVDARKVNDILALGKATLRSPWMRAAAALFQSRAQRSADASIVTDESLSCSRLSSPYQSGSTEGIADTTLVDELMKELRKVPHNRGYLPALGLLMQRLLEANAERVGATSLRLSASQTQFYLYLLHQWFSSYVTPRHRWSVEDMFNATDDTDLWCFLLDRHSACLMWSLTDSAPCAGQTEAGVPKDLSLSRLEVISGAVDRLQAILYSVAHCLQIYRSSLAVFTSAEKRELRWRTAMAATHSWMKTTGVEKYCRAMLNDLLDSAELLAERCEEERTFVEQRALLIEGELKFAIFDTNEMLRSPDLSPGRLETLVGVAVELCETWMTRAAQIEKGATSRPTDAKILVAPVITLMIRCLQRIRCYALRADVPSSEFNEAQAGRYGQLLQLVKRAVKVAKDTGSDASGLWDEWRGLICLPIPTSPAARAVNPTDSISDMAFFGYSTSMNKTGLGAPRGAVNAGLEDLCFERRHFSKSLKAEEWGAVGNLKVERATSTPPPQPTTSSTYKRARPE